MNIEYPPILVGNYENKINLLRSYLYRTAEQLNYALAATENNSLPDVSSGQLYGSTSKGRRTIFETDSGWNVQETASGITGANLIGIDGFDLFAAVLCAANAEITDPVTVLMFRYGNKISGSTSYAVLEGSTGVVTIMLQAEISKVNGAPELTLKSAEYIIHLSGSDHSLRGTLPGGADTPVSGFTVRALYALVK